MVSGKNDSAGFGELASSSLPTLGGNPLQPSWSRSLQELAASNHAFINENPQQSMAAARVLLGDRTDFGSLAASLDAPAKPKKEVFASVEETCRRHRDGTIERILQEERERTQKKLDAAVERQMEDDWAREREWWMQEIVGTRNLVDSSNSLAGQQVESQILGSALQALSDPSQNMLAGSQPSIQNKKLDPRTVKNHLDLVQTMSPNSSLPDVFSKFCKLAATDSNAYATSWQLMSSVIPKLNSPINGARGSLIHFCRQFQVIVKNRVASASLAGQDVSTPQNYGSSMGGTIAAYVKLESGSNSSVWDLLYFCLRCGDALAAKSVLDVASTAHGNFPEQPMIQNVILQLCQKQGTASCLWESENQMVSNSDRGAVADLYERAVNLEPNNTHKVSVLALLSGKPLSVFNTIEDYLFGRLWLSLQHDDPAAQIQSIGESIRKCGPDYFGDEDSGGWGYTLPLLASQQFKTALTYLAEAGGAIGLLQAVHLGLAFAMGGVPVNDLGRQSSSGCLVTALLVKYASSLEAEPTIGALPAFEYLLKIPSKERSRHEVASLLARSYQLVDYLGGVLTEEGSRQNGELDKRLPADEVSAILAEAAEIFRKQAHERSKAELSAKLFMLAGRFSALLVLLNELISPVDVDGESQRYWCDQAERFYTTYLAKRSVALVTLEREDNLQLVTTNKQLMDLRRFFGQVRSEQFFEAFNAVTQLDLIPLTQDDLSEKQSRFRDLESILKDQFPMLLVGTVQCLYGLHRKVKSESRGMDPNAEMRLKELQYKARLIYIYSGLVCMPTSTKEDIQRMRNHMI